MTTTRRVWFFSGLLAITFGILHAQAGKGIPGTAAGIKWTASAHWSLESEGPARMVVYKATYKVPAAAGDPEAGECSVYFFGAGQGGGVQANLDRWSGQFQTPGGQPIANPKTQKQTIAGFAVTTVDITGTYMQSSGPMMAAKEAKPNYRMISAVVEGKQGNIFFKFTGPKKTVTAAEADFNTMLKSLKGE
jgi:hypothetical protein